MLIGLRCNAICGGVLLGETHCWLTQLQQSQNQHNGDYKFTLSTWSLPKPGLVTLAARCQFALTPPSYTLMYVVGVKQFLCEAPSLTGCAMGTMRHLGTLPTMIAVPLDHGPTRFCPLVEDVGG